MAMALSSLISKKVDLILITINAKWRAVYWLSIRKHYIKKVFFIAFFKVFIVFLKFFYSVRVYFEESCIMTEPEKTKIEFF